MAKTPGGIMSVFTVDFQIILYINYLIIIFIYINILYLYIKLLNNNLYKKNLFFIFKFI